MDSKTKGQAEPTPNTEELQREILANMLQNILFQTRHYPGLSMEQISGIIHTTFHPDDITALIKCLLKK